MWLHCPSHWGSQFLYFRHIGIFHSASSKIFEGPEYKLCEQGEEINGVDCTVAYQCIGTYVTLDERGLVQPIQAMAVVGVPVGSRQRGNMPLFARDGSWGGPTRRGFTAEEKTKL